MPPPPAAPAPDRARDRPIPPPEATAQAASVPWLAYSSPDPLFFRLHHRRRLVRHHETPSLSSACRVSLRSSAIASGTYWSAPAQFRPPHDVADRLRGRIDRLLRGECTTVHSSFRGLSHFENACILSDRFPLTQGRIDPISAYR